MSRLAITFYEITAQIRLKSDTDTGYRFASGVKATVQADETISKIFLAMKSLADKKFKTTLIGLSNVKIVKVDYPADGYKITVHCDIQEKNEIVYCFLNKEPGDQVYEFFKLFDHMCEVAVTLNPEFQDVAHIRITPLDESKMPVKFMTG